MSQSTYDDRETTGWVGWISFAGVMMIIGGVLNFIYGLIAAVNDDWVVFTNRTHVAVDLTTWGWVHMVVGVVVPLADLRGLRFVEAAGVNQRIDLRD